MKKNLLKKQIKKIINKEFAERNEMGFFDLFGDPFEKIEKELKDLAKEISKKMLIPVRGSIIYCDLLAFEHSGIYVGNGEIVHLDGSGMVEKIDANTFINRLDGFNLNGDEIYVSCDEYGTPIGRDEIAERAERMVGTNYGYNLILKNCHIFTTGCLTGDFENSKTFLWMLKDEAEKQIGAKEWLPWSKRSDNYLVFENLI